MGHNPYIDEAFANSKLLERLGRQDERWASMSPEAGQHKTKWHPPNQVVNGKVTILLWRIRRTQHDYAPGVAKAS